MSNPVLHHVPCGGVGGWHNLLHCHRVRPRHKGPGVQLNGAQNVHNSILATGISWSGNLRWMDRLY